MTAIPQSLPRHGFLRTVLLADAATCAAMGLLLLVVAGVLSPLFELPIPLLRYAGLALLPIAAFMAWVATRNPPPRSGALLVVAGNWAWVVASLLLLVSGWVAPNALGVVFVMVQAAAVVILAALEMAGLRRP